MAKAHDILLDENGIPVIKDGDYVVAESDEQHIQDIFLSDSGVWRDAVVLGIGILGYVNAPNSLEEKSKLERTTRANLEYDGISERIAFLEQEVKSIKKVIED